MGITDPNNLYSPFLANYLNYISWISSSILNTANLIDHLLGLNSYVSENIIETTSGARVILSYDCLGLGIISFWIAYIIADISSWQNKILWSISGALLIWFINCWRIAILLLALQNKWNASQNIDHHQVFNYVSYVIIFLLIMYYNYINTKSIDPASNILA